MESNLTPKSDAVAFEIGRIIGRYTIKEYSPLQTCNAINQQMDQMRDIELELAEAHKEGLEQARLNGMGVEREAALLGEQERLKRALFVAKELLQNIPLIQHTLDTVDTALSLTPKPS